MRPLPRSASAAGFLTALALASGGLLAVAGAAGAAEPGDTPGDLVVDVGDSVMMHRAMEPGDERHWTLTTVLQHAPSADLRLRVESEGLLAASEDGLRLALDRCEAPWRFEDPGSPTCPPGASPVVAPTALSRIDPAAVLDLGTIAGGTGPYFLATVALPDLAPSELQAADAVVGFGFTAGADDAVAILPLSPSGPLAATGASLGGPLLLAAGILLAGFTLLRVRAVRR